MRTCVRPGRFHGDFATAWLTRLLDLQYRVGRGRRTLRVGTRGSAGFRPRQSDKSRCSISLRWNRMKSGHVAKDTRPIRHSVRERAGSCYGRLVGGCGTLT